jgi:hypothetical protein
MLGGGGNKDCDAVKVLIDRELRDPEISFVASVRILGRYVQINRQLVVS